MKKVPDVIALVAQLRARFGDDVALEDHWDGDLLAIGLGRTGRPGRLAYVSLTDGECARFYVALELAPSSGSDLPYQEGCVHHDLSMAAAIDVVARHLGLQ